MKKISVIVPCYNVEREIDRCVQSLVAQSLSISNMELIFVDDALRGFHRTEAFGLGS